MNLIINYSCTPKLRITLRPQTIFNVTVVSQQCLEGLDMTQYTIDELNIQGEACMHYVGQSLLPWRGAQWHQEPVLVQSMYSICLFSSKVKSEVSCITVALCPTSQAWFPVSIRLLQSLSYEHTIVSKTRTIVERCCRSNGCHCN